MQQDRLAWHNRIVSFSKPTSAGLLHWPADPTSRVSGTIATLGALLIIATGLYRYLVDASLWIDEATVAHTIRTYSPSAYFGRLYGEQMFPRLYLLLIKGQTEVLGYGSLVLRSLPLAAYVIATALWMKLLFSRFSRTPAILVVGVALAIVPTTWTVFGVMLKQYSLDTMLALCALALSDATLESIFERGERRYRAALLFLPWLFSYTYVFAIAGRCAGYLLWRVSRGGRRLDAASAGIALIAFTASAGLLYHTDVQYTPMALLTHQWDRCLLIGSSGVAAGTIDNLALGWYRTSHYFRYTELANPLIWILRGLTVIGLLGSVVFGLGRSRAESAVSHRWGSRTIAVPMTLLVLIVGSVPLSYPLCAGRLTLFVLLPLQLLALEGLFTLTVWLRRAPRGPSLAALAALVLGAALLPAAFSSVSRLVIESPPGNLRLALSEIRSVPERPVVVDPCTHEMIKALPDDWAGIAVLKSIYARKHPALDGRRHEDVWVLRGVRRCWVMGLADDLLRRATYDWRPVWLPTEDVKLRMGRVRETPPRGRSGT